MKSKYIIIGTLVVLGLFSFPIFVFAGLGNRLSGYILLQVQSHGEAWYVEPVTQKRYYMKDGETAYNMLRAFGLGITNNDLEKVQSGNKAIVDKLKGRIVLQVQSHGEAYYIHPDDGRVHYLKDGNAAYTIMREVSLGITNADLNNIASHDFDSYYANKFSGQVANTNSVNNTSETTANLTKGFETTPAENVSEPIESVSINGIDVSAVNTYWLGRINDLRSVENLRLLVIDQRWIDTATEWAIYMGSELQTASHQRPDGKSMHKWIDAKDLDFTKRHSNDGWKTNYFTENIGYGYTRTLSQESVEKILDDLLDFYLSEKSYNGSHYRTIYHQDWNSVGVGLYIDEQASGGYKVYVAMHYGSLNL